MTVPEATAAFAGSVARLPCRVLACSARVPAADMRRHVASHYYHGNPASRIPASAIGATCGFCGLGAGCAVRVAHVGGNNFTVKSECDYAVELRVGSAAAGSNVPEPCAVAGCDASPWRYNVEGHYAAAHADVVPPVVSEAALAKRRLWSKSGLNVGARRETEPRRHGAGRGGAVGSAAGSAAGRKRQRHAASAPTAAAATTTVASDDDDDGDGGSGDDGRESDTAAAAARTFNVGDRVMKKHGGATGQVVQLILGETDDGNGGTEDGVALYRVTYDDQLASRYEELAAADLQLQPSERPGGLNCVRHARRACEAGELEAAWVTADQ